MSTTCNLTLSTADDVNNPYHVKQDLEWQFTQVPGGVSYRWIAAVWLKFAYYDANGLSDNGLVQAWGQGNRFTGTTANGGSLVDRDFQADAFAHAPLTWTYVNLSYVSTWQVWKLNDGGPDTLVASGDGPSTTSYRWQHTGPNNPAWSSGGG